MLLTKELENRFNEVWSQEEVSDPIVIAKFFHPMSNRVWYATEYDPVEQIFFWFVDWDFGERWSFSLKEMRSINVMWLPLERDRYWDEEPFSKIKIRNDN
jgi:hypothetical protein